MNDTTNPKIPFAKYQGVLQLRDKDVDCYVLDTGERVVSMRATVKAIANTVTGKLGNYIGIKALQSYISEEQIMNDIIDFSIEGALQNGKGIKAETFLDICQAYVDAFSNVPEELTERQKEIAMNCAILLSACAKTGLIALIDEATGYQYVRENDALQVKIRAFIAEELREWEKTFPDELWEEFGRLTNWKGSLYQRPKYWGKLVMEIIYDALDPDVARYLKDNKPKPIHGQNYHQWLTQDVGLKALVPHIYQIIGIAKTCTTMSELRAKVALFYKKEPMQLEFLKNIEEMPNNENPGSRK